MVSHIDSSRRIFHSRYDSTFMWSIQGKRSSAWYNLIHFFSLYSFLQVFLPKLIILFGILISVVLSIRDCGWKEEKKMVALIVSFISLYLVSTYYFQINNKFFPGLLIILIILVILIIIGAVVYFMCFRNKTPPSEMSIWKVFSKVINCRENRGRDSSQSNSARYLQSHS